MQSKIYPTANISNLPAEVQLWKHCVGSFTVPECWNRSKRWHVVIFLWWGDEANVALAAGIFVVIYNPRLVHFNPFKPQPFSGTC